MLNLIIKSILIGSVLLSSASALEMKKHKKIDDGTGTTITFEGKRVEK